MAQSADDQEYTVDDRPSPSRSTYFPQLEGLRGVLASYVVLHHTLLQAWPIASGVPVHVPPTLAWLLYGRFAVDAFIVLSGVRSSRAGGA